MANTTFLEPGGDADFGIGLWPNVVGSPTVATDFVHGGHIKSIQFPANIQNYLLASNKASDAGGRVDKWVYFNTLPTGTVSFLGLEQAGDGLEVNSLQITSVGGLKLSITGGTGGTVSSGAWHRITFDWVITSTTVNTFKVYLDGSLVITDTNVSITNTASADVFFGNINADATMDLRISDVYIDNSSALTDPGTIWVTAKRTFSNGTTNGYTTQIGSGGSGYGTGHAPQVNERPNSDTNGWSMIGAGSAITEEYNIESVSQGDINITGATIVDYMGWIRTSALVSETGNIIVNGVSTNITIPTTTAFITKIAGSTTYPAGTGSDIGEITSTTLTTVSLYEAGIIVAYIPSVGGTQYYSSLATLGCS